MCHGRSSQPTLYVFFHYTTAHCTNNMSDKDYATIDVGYPVFTTKFLSDERLVIGGGGGEGKNGVKNKIVSENLPKRKVSLTNLL